MANDPLPYPAASPPPATPHPPSRATGPRTAAGKAISSRNATTHGIYAATPVLPGVEDPHHWELFRRAAFDALKPVGVLEEAKAEQLAALQWRLRRVLRYETNAAATAWEDAPLDAACAVAQSLPAAPHTHAASSAGGDPPLCADLIPFPADRWRHILFILTHSLSLPDTHPLHGDDVTFTVAAVASVAHGQRRFAWDLGIPGFPSRGQLDAVTGWTVGHLRRALDHVAAGLGRPTQAIVDDAVDCLRAIIPPYPWEATAVPAASAALAPLADDHPEVIRLRRERLLPAADVTVRVARYEAHLTRQIAAAERSLARLQARRGATTLAHFGPGFWR